MTSDTAYVKGKIRIRAIEWRPPASEDGDTASYKVTLAYDGTSETPTITANFYYDQDEHTDGDILKIAKKQFHETCKMLAKNTED